MLGQRERRHRRLAQDAADPQQDSVLLDRSRRPPVPGSCRGVPRSIGAPKTYDVGLGRSSVLLENVKPFSSMKPGHAATIRRKIKAASQFFFRSFKVSRFYATAITGGLPLRREQGILLQALTAERLRPIVAHF